VRIHWTNKALNDLISIYEYIGQSSPGYADQTVDRLTRRIEQIEVFPESGRAVPEYERDDIRELIERPYRVIYQIGEE
jgi:plasmid stabilization system protein ParE